jgi:cold shock CspA family protein
VAQQTRKTRGMTENQEIGPFERGYIREYCIEKKFGFITRWDGVEIYMHHSGIVFQGKVNCNHDRGICARAVGLIHPAYTGSFTNLKVIERLLIGQRVKFRTYTTPAGRLEASGVKADI